MKKFLTFIIILVLLALVVFLGFKLLDNNENNKNEIIDNTVNEEQNNTSNNETNSNTTSQSEGNQQNEENNTTIYIGTEGNFTEFKIDIDKDGSPTYQASQILESIGDILGYRLIANDITDGKGGMTVDFNASSAPFNTYDSYIGNEQYTVSDDNLAFTIFDSIEKTLQEYFGQNLDVWFSLDSGSITIDDIHIPITEPYQGSNYYQQ